LECSDFIVKEEQGVTRREDFIGQTTANLMEIFKDLQGKWRRKKL
jgi:hypothetical protein